MGSIPIRFRQTLSRVPAVGAEQMARKTISKRKSKRKKKTFSAATEARRQARELQGTPPPTRVIPDKRGKPPKYKKELLEEG